MCTIATSPSHETEANPLRSNHQSLNDIATIQMNYMGRLYTSTTLPHYKLHTVTPYHKSK